MSCHLRARSNGTVGKELSTAAPRTDWSYMRIFWTSDDSAILRLLPQCSGITGASSMIHELFGWPNSCRAVHGCVGPCSIVGFDFTRKCSCSHLCSSAELWLRTSRPCRYTVLLLRSWPSGLSEVRGVPQCVTTSTREQNSPAMYKQRIRAPCCYECRLMR